jgi:hypothetical protein
MAIQLNLENYPSLITSIQGLFSAGNVAAVTMSIYSDADASVIYPDSNGNPISNRPISSAVKQDTSVDADGNILIGSITVQFSDGTAVTVPDGSPSHWYSLSTKTYY